MHEEPARERARAIVSPASGEIVLTVPGKAAPVAVEPPYTELKRSLRPCTSGAAGVRTWQPLHSSTSPGRTEQPGAMHGAHAPAVDVEQADLERDVRRHFHAHRAIGLDRCIGDDLAHHAGRTECGIVRVGDVVIVGNRYRLLDADEAHLALRELRVRRIRNVGDRRGGAVVGARLVDTHDVVDAADRRAGPRLRRPGRRRDRAALVCRGSRPAAACAAARRSPR